MMWWGQGFSWGWMLFGGLMMILFWGGIISLIVVAIRSLTGAVSSTANPTPTNTSRSALRILKERYAHGEIAKEEYEDMRYNLIN